MRALPSCPIYTGAKEVAEASGREKEIPRWPLLVDSGGPSTVGCGEGGGAKWLADMLGHCI